MAAKTAYTCFGIEAEIYATNLHLHKQIKQSSDTAIPFPTLFRNSQRYLELVRSVFVFHKTSRKHLFLDRGAMHCYNTDVQMSPRKMEQVSDLCKRYFNKSVKHFRTILIIPK